MTEQTDINGATVFLPEDKIEDEVYGQIHEITEHEAFTAEDIAIMPDTHYGKGAPIGLTMPVTDRVVPNLVGVDVGCGVMTGLTQDISPDYWEDGEWANELTQRIQETVPMGRQRRTDDVKNLVKTIDFEQCEQNLATILQYLGYSQSDLPSWFDGYGEQYVKDLEKRINYHLDKIITSLGSLGGGNHFIEFGESQQLDAVGVTIHCGSRGLGKHIAEHWQEQAHQQTFERKAQISVPEDDLKYLHVEGEIEREGDTAYVNPNDLAINGDAIRSDYEGAAIDGKFGQMKQYLTAGKENKSDLDWLSGKRALGYYVDMIFGQQYAYHNRRIILNDVFNVLREMTDQFAEPKVVHNSTHNFIDVNQEHGHAMLRKGATPAYNNDTVLIPYDMEHGTVIAEGRGNEDWNYSAPHGAGRVMSRRGAKDALSEDVVAERMKDIHTMNIPLDEAPQAYKNAAMIESQIGDTVSIIDRLEPLHNIKP